MPRNNQNNEQLSPEERTQLQQCQQELEGILNSLSSPWIKRHLRKELCLNEIQEVLHPTPKKTEANTKTPFTDLSDNTSFSSTPTPTPVDDNAPYIDVVLFYNFLTKAQAFQTLLDPTAATPQKNSVLSAKSVITGSTGLKVLQFSLTTTSVLASAAAATFLFLFGAALFPPVGVALAVGAVLLIPPFIAFAHQVLTQHVARKKVAAAHQALGSVGESKKLAFESSLGELLESQESQGQRASMASTRSSVTGVSGRKRTKLEIPTGYYRGPIYKPTPSAPPVTEGSGLSSTPGFGNNSTQ